MSNNQFDLDVRISTPARAQKPSQPNFLTIGSTCGSCGGGFPCYTWNCTLVLACLTDYCGGGTPGCTITCSTCDC